MATKLSLLLAIAALLLVFASVNTFAYNYTIQNFTNCTNTTIYVEVDAITPLADGEYELLGCEKLTEPDVIPQRWACICEGEFNLVLDTAFVIKNAYLISISSSSQDDLPAVAGILEEMQAPAPLPKNTPTPRNTNKITAAVTGVMTAVKPLAVGGFVGVLVLLIFLSFSLRSKGLPWDSPEEKARKLHAKAKQAYVKGEYKKAKRRYERASRLRNS